MDPIKKSGVNPGTHIHYFIDITLKYYISACVSIRVNYVSMVYYCPDISYCIHSGSVV